MGVRWVRAVVEGPGGCSAGKKEDTVLFETEDALALAAREGPAVIISVGEWRLYVHGEDVLSNLAEAIAAAFEEHARSRAAAGA